MKRGVFLIVLIIFSLIIISNSDSLDTNKGIRICSPDNPLCVDYYDIYCSESNYQSIEAIIGAGYCEYGTTTSVVCGNGIKETGEQCDDGNTRNGDGCSSTCIIEPQNCDDYCSGTTFYHDGVYRPSDGVCVYQRETNSKSCGYNACVPNAGSPCGCTGTVSCNGQCVGDTAKSTYYRDVDNDGYGSTTSTLACSKPAGYVTNNQDCNDNNANINPGKIEKTSALCSDNLDNDCDTSIDCRDSQCAGVTKTNGQTCCTSYTSCSLDQTCESNVCITPTKTGNPVCCLTYSECLSAALKNQNDPFAWPKQVDCIQHGITELPECY